MTFSTAIEYRYLYKRQVPETRTLGDVVWEREWEQKSKMPSRQKGKRGDNYEDTEKTAEGTGMTTK